MYEKQVEKFIMICWIDGRKENKKWNECRYKMWITGKGVVVK